MKKSSKFALGFLTCIFSGLVFLYWYFDYQRRGYSELVGFPFPFYEFQGGIAGTITDQFNWQSLILDIIIIFLASLIISWIIIKLWGRFKPTD